ncbi:MAG: HD domain-containing protein [Anaerovoracaceae bacterium]|jgi:uncharacterized protein
MERKLLDQLFEAMVSFYRGDPKRIQHFTKVHSFARLIGVGEGLDEKTLLTLEAAAYVHDIGIKPAEEKYGRCDGKLQEKEGPAPARAMLEKIGFDSSITDRVAYLVGRHHTYTGIDGADCRILIEADFLVNMYEDGLSREAIGKAYENIFRTASGRRLCREMYGLGDVQQ